ncbi:hypothetical protein BU24DRAFT_119719 [Aaosphaeria arxii CBS 175.79]|uniref:Uncharacterized protein n=1 Tax=Aaosphaeria arxii CBS 175.79 TaxID=1450172 RepID=A0A6A5Y2F9_9PLEO|nr:uncharacterized protein BU24DRAFT_119719 [Aaosphaeria arxii CBS 175.79]KAF2019416.1 hypothetical protein BU24DRAFT_119719 [Aaosphaeria arxii CBS 175.79]
MPDTHHSSNWQLVQNTPGLIRTNSESYSSPSLPMSAGIARTNSDLIAAPRPVPAAQLLNHRNGRVQWNLGSEG